MQFVFLFFYCFEWLYNLCDDWEENFWGHWHYIGEAYRRDDVFVTGGVWVSFVVEKSNNLACA